MLTSSGPCSGEGAPLTAELRDAMGEARHLAARGVGMHDALLRRAHDHRLCFLQSSECLGAVAARDRFLDLAHETAHLRASPLVDFGASGDLAGGLAGGTGISHACARCAGADAARGLSSGSMS